MRNFLSITARDLIGLSAVCCVSRARKAFWYVVKNWNRVVSKRREIMARKRVDDDYIARWFRYDPVSLPAPRSKSAARAVALQSGDGRDT